ncbi:hypothetical protein KR222_003438 [Zaprionus bogoriensis]|nr:hypothetical protein KR222_003438 [Zaprionus bogoriensis]
MHIPFQVFNKANCLKMSNKFFYFGFGSNMLAGRIHIQNPTARRVGAGKLENYRLDFHGDGTNSWLGSPATIVPMPGSRVFGAIWEIDTSNLKDLDDQEGVAAGVYKPINVPVQDLASNKEIVCRAYHLTNQPETDLHGSSGTGYGRDIPYNRQPSLTYLKVLVKGAEETGIPADYISWLKSLKHNNNVVEAMENRLKLSDVEL